MSFEWKITDALIYLHSEEHTGHDYNIKNELFSNLSNFRNRT